MEVKTITFEEFKSQFENLEHVNNVLQLTDSFCFSQKFWLGAVIGCPSFVININN